MKKRLNAVLLCLSLLTGLVFFPQEIRAEEASGISEIEHYTLQEIPGSTNCYEEGKDLPGSMEVQAANAVSLPSDFETQYVNEAQNKLYTVTAEGISCLDLLTREEQSVYQFAETGTLTEVFVAQSRVYLAFYSGTEENKILVINRSSGQPEQTYTVDSYISAVGADKSGNILVATNKGADNHPILKIDASGKTQQIGSTHNAVTEFVAAPGNGLVYYTVTYNWRYWGYDHTMCGLTYAAYNGTAFTESATIVKQLYQVGFTFYQEPVTFLTDTLAMDYLGNIYSVSKNPKGDSGLAHLFSVERNNHELDDVYGQGCQAAYFSSTKEIVGKNKDNILYAYNLDTKKLTASYTAENYIYSVYKVNDKLVSVEYNANDTMQKSVELIDRKSFTEVKSRIVNLNQQQCYQNRTREMVVQKYQEALKGVDLSKKLLSKNGSYKKPYAGTTMSKTAQAALLKFSNYQRWLAGLTSYKTGSTQTIANTGKGAVLLSVATEMGHDPAKPADMPADFYEQAKSVTGGNISYGTAATIGDGIASIRGLTDDTANASNNQMSINDGAMTYVQGYNTPGHRNTFLQRGGTNLTYGAANGIFLQYYEYAQRNPNASGTIAETKNNEMAYTWPSPGYFPVEEIDKKAVWTVYFNTDQIDFGNGAPTITITDLATKKEYARSTPMSQDKPSQKGYSWTNFWGKSLSFSPPDVSDLKGKSYQVSIGNLEDSDGRETTLEYTIHFFSYAVKAQMKSATLSKTSYSYDGKAKKPVVTVRDSSNEKIPAQYYTVSYKNNKNIGKATVTIKGKGKYAGTTLKKTFTIKEKKGSKFVVKNGSYQVTGSGQVSFLGLKKSKSSVSIPQTVKIGGKNFKVTAIAERAFRNASITKVTVGDNVKTIGASAFENCTKLTEVKLGRKVAKIGSRAFYGTKKLKKMTVLSKELKTIGKNALRGTKADAKIVVPKACYKQYQKLFKGKGQGRKVKIVK